MAPIKATINLRLVPFCVPESVTVYKVNSGSYDGLDLPQKIKLKDLDESTLNILCDTFRNEVFEKANQKTR